MDINKAQKIEDTWALAHYLAERHKKTSNKTVGEYAAALGDPRAQHNTGKVNRISGRKGRNRDTGGIKRDMKRFRKSEDTKIEKKINPGLAALAGWYLSGDVTRDLGQPTAAQAREFERQIQRAMRKKGRALRKESAINKMQLFFNTKDNTDTYIRKTPVSNAVQADSSDIQKRLSIAPFQGARFDPVSHRWTKPENIGNTVHNRGGKKRIRATGTGTQGSRSVSGHGKGRIRGEGAGRKYKGETDLAGQRRKEGFTSSRIRSTQKKHRGGK